MTVKRDFKSMALKHKSINLKMDNTDNVVMKTNLTNPRGRIEHYVGKKNIWNMLWPIPVVFKSARDFGIFGKVTEKKTNLSWGISVLSRTSLLTVRT